MQRGRQTPIEFHHARVGKVLTMVKAGISMKDIADHFGRSKEAIYLSFRKTNRLHEIKEARIGLIDVSVGDVYGDRTVISFIEKGFKWQTRCKCGKMQTLSTSELKEGTSCYQCAKNDGRIGGGWQRKDHTGKRYGLWEFVKPDKDLNWIVKCNGCDRTFSRQPSSIAAKSGTSRSCVQCRDKVKR
ncbi:MAG: hypothetical protein AAF282_02995 [Cyanobacteria bacterium P01_A01_bin.15]